MTKHYQIEIVKTKTILRATYINDTFKKIERLRGKISKETLSKIGHIIPYNTEDISRLNKAYFGKVNYSVEPNKSQTIYTQFLNEWFCFYEDFMQVKPKFNATQGKHLKQIISYLKSISKDDTEALSIWKMILQTWHKLDDFYRKSADLKFINSQLNKILINVKEINQSTAANIYHSAAAKSFKFK